jgi:peptidoglycan/xylan/chitin deacetylase (PgdA/CDA1 family)
MKSRNGKIVPALMFHSVGLQDHQWVWSYISESIESFEAKLRLFKEKGFVSVFWQDVYEHMCGSGSLPDNAIFLTFDDGYLDNWLNVFPLLKKYEMKGTIFVTSDFVDPGVELRNRNQGADNPAPDTGVHGSDRQESQDAGFLNWNEMRAMEESGLVDIQSHAKTHTWYFSGPRIVDFHRPHRVTPYPWLFWNAAPERKPFYLNEDQQELLPWGYPILEHGKSLEIRRFFPSAEAVEEITSVVRQLGGSGLFQSADWRSAILRNSKCISAEGEVAGRYESDEEWGARIEEELLVPKNCIESHLHKEVPYICWPGGANSVSVQNMAREIGYRSWTLSSRDQTQKRNVPGANPESVKRIGTSNRIEVKGRYCGDGGAYFQLLRVLDHQHSFLAKVLLKAYKFFALLTAIWRKR